MIQIICRTPTCSKREIIMRIERASYRDPWSWADFTDMLKVAVNKQLGIVGFVAWFGLPTELRITNIAVDPIYRRQGIGSQMLKYLYDKLSYSRREALSACVPVGVHTIGGKAYGPSLFFRDAKPYGFRWVETILDERGKDHSYLMRCANRICHENKSFRRQ